MPPTTSTMFSFMNFAYLRAASVTCLASSRVGARTSTRGVAAPFSGSSAVRVSAGSMKAAVLPVPVSAVARMSRPWSAGGMAASWTGVGVVYSNASRAFRTSGCRPSSENVKS